MLFLAAGLVVLYRILVMIPMRTAYGPPPQFSYASIGGLLYTTTIEDVYGDILIVNNSDLRMILNTSANLSPAICDAYISYDQNIENVEKIIEEAVEAMKENIPAIKEGPKYRGVQKIDEKGILIRIYAKTEELDKYQTVRDMNRQLKIIFEKREVKFGFPTVIVQDNKEVKHPEE